MIIMCVCFVLFRNEPNFGDLPQDERPAGVILMIIYSIVASLLLIPLPLFCMQCFKNKYYLSHRDALHEDGVVYDDKEK